MPTILIGGDLVPLGRTLPAFVEGDAEGIFHDLLPEFEKADMVIANLECPLIVRPSPIAKSGRVLGAPVDCVRALAKAGIDAVNLANNHILDHGEEGLRSTLKACRETGIETVGAGENHIAAGRILIRTVAGVRIGFMGVAEHEWSVAAADAWGANPLDPAHYVRMLRRHRGQYDFLVVLVHGGIERYHYPPPRLMDMCRFMVEEGAGAVICQHSHCAGCYEQYQGAPIVYGQGNLLFDLGPATSCPGWNEGFLVKLIVEAGSLLRMELVPILQSDGQPGARCMPDDGAGTFLRAVRERSDAIRDPGFVERAWLEWCRARMPVYMSYLRGHGRVLRSLYGRLPWLCRQYPRMVGLVALDIIRCESHREVIETFLSDCARPRGR